MALGQAIGRWGNYVNQELYGPPTNLPWKIYIAPENRVPGYQQYEYFHPVFLYESLWNFANMALLLWLGKRYADRLKSGDLFLTYMIMYPVGRFLLEFLRLDSSQVAGINANQALMLIVAICASIWLFMRHRSGGQDAMTAIPVIDAPADGQFEASASIDGTSEAPVDQPPEAEKTDS